MDSDFRKEVGAVENKPNGNFSDNQGVFLQEKIFPVELTDVVVRPKPDRRALPNIPNQESVRTTGDRRNSNQGRKRLRRSEPLPSLPEHQGVRYLVRRKVRVTCHIYGKKSKSFVAESEDISTSGMLLRITDFEERKALDSANRIKLKFRLLPGDLPEGYEMKVKLRAKRKRIKEQGDGTYDYALEFQRSLTHYAYKHKGKHLRRMAILAFLLLIPVLILLRVDATMYVTFNQVTYIYGMITATYLITRYLFGALYKPVSIDDSFTPGVTIVIPCFNEEMWIGKTILSCINQHYPQDKLEVIIVDDCSQDSSVERIEELLEALYQEDRYNIRERLRFVRQETNQGKREAIVRGARLAKHDLLAFVDSDSFLDPHAIINLVQPFRDPRMGGVSGRTDVANTYTNFVTRMQSVRYYVSFRIMKAAEAYFDAVTCLSGPLSCYRKSIVLENAEKWLHQKFLGVKATFGDDRAMTNFVLKKHRTTYQDTAVCSTIVPNTHRVFLKQQIRWKRSWLRESLGAATFMWRKEPLMAIFFYFGILIPILSPLIVLYNLAYIPILYGFFPRTFLIGLLVMSLMMSMTQLMMRRSSTWWYAIAFCAYYLLILMWQMPYAWLTFWKSNWGTRETQEDQPVSTKRVQMQTEQEGAHL